MGRVVVLGSINVDLTATVARLPAAGETLSGGQFTTTAGGKGANQALAAARAGAPTALAGAVGSDAFAALALAGLKGAGVDLAGVREVGGPTGTAMILVAADGENVIVVVPGANAAVGPAQARALSLDSADVLLLQGEVPPETLAAACAEARSARAHVVLNAAPFDPAHAGLLDHVDVLVVNEVEAEALAAASGIASRELRDVARGLAGRGRDVVVTRSARGLVAALRGGALVELDALPVRALDTVGAGDAFCGYLAAELFRHRPLDERALRVASVAAALTCTRPGAQDAIPGREECLGRLAGPAREG